MECAYGMCLLKGWASFKGCRRGADVENGIMSAPAWFLAHLRRHDHLLSIEEFMEASLYDAEGGYYTTSIKGVGRDGDFSTAPSHGDLLARALFATYEDACSSAGERLPIIEIGGGAGQLGASFREHLGFWGRLRTSYTIVEVSPVLRELQRERTNGFVRHAGSVAEALRGGQFKEAGKASKAGKSKGAAFIVSNELADAFPARQWELCAEGWREVMLDFSPRRTGQPRIVECLRESKLPSSSVFDPARNPRLAEYALGQRVETQMSYRDWLREWVPLWRRGLMVTIDYGQEVEGLYRRQPKGSLRAYKHHELIVPPELYYYPGKLDLTCDVNFTDVRAFGEELGLRTQEIMSQREFLLPFLRSSTRENPHDAFLTDPIGAGEAFRVLIQVPS